MANLARDADAGASVCHSGREVVDAGRFMETCETSHVVLAPTRVIYLDVLAVFFAQLLDGLLNVSVGRGKDRQLSYGGLLWCKCMNSVCLKLNL